MSKKIAIYSELYGEITYEKFFGERRRFVNYSQVSRHDY